MPMRSTDSQMKPSATSKHCIARAGIGLALRLTVAGAAVALLKSARIRASAHHTSRLPRHNSIWQIESSGTKGWDQCIGH